MGERKKFKAKLSSTRLDLQGEQFTKEELERIVKETNEEDIVSMLFNEHQTTLPPLGYGRAKSVEIAEDGEYELIAEGEMFDKEDYICLQESNIHLPVAGEEKKYIFPVPASIQISYNPFAISSSEIKPLIDNLGKIAPTAENLVAQKSQIPQEVIWFMLLAVTGGFLQKMGEGIADETVKITHAFLEKCRQTLINYFQTRNHKNPDVIFQIPFQEQMIVIEGAVISPNEKILCEAFDRLPELFALAAFILESNKKGYFRNIKLIFNPKSDQWEVNYLMTKKLERIILGPRYFDKSHPLFCQFDQVVEDAINKKGISISLGGYRQ